MMSDYHEQIMNAGNSDEYPLWSFAGEVARQAVFYDENIPTHRLITQDGEVVGAVEIPAEERSRMHTAAVSHNMNETARSIARIEEYRVLCQWESNSNSQAITEEFAKRLFPEHRPWVSSRQRGTWDLTSVIIVLIVAMVILLAAVVR